MHRDIRINPRFFNLELVGDGIGDSLVRLMRYEQVNSSAFWPASAKTSREMSAIERTATLNNSLPFILK